MIDNFVWQCKCGHIAHGNVPEDCPQCLAVNKFKRVPEDQIEEAMEEEVLSMKLEENEEDLEEFE
ncbi:hypothetical protein J4462_02000 [Candidatus Pacearchaeota archaeon]|nr:hypothetical protein [Candidatus Pacearchaeota archaeon]